MTYALIFILLTAQGGVSAGHIPLDSYVTCENVLADMKANLKGLLVYGSCTRN